MTTYYVKPSFGSGGDGSEATPWDSVTDAAGADIADDLIRLVNGETETISSELNINVNSDWAGYGDGASYHLKQSTNNAKVVNVFTQTGVEISGVELSYTVTAISGGVGIAFGGGASNHLTDFVIHDAYVGIQTTSSETGLVVEQGEVYDTEDDGVQHNGTGSASFRSLYIHDVDVGGGNGDCFQATSSWAGVLSVLNSTADHSSADTKNSIIIGPSVNGASDTALVADCVITGAFNSLNCRGHGSYLRNKVEEPASRGININVGNASTVQTVVGNTSVSLAKSAEDGAVIEDSDAVNLNEVYLMQTTVYGDFLRGVRTKSDAAEGTFYCQNNIFLSSSRASSVAFRADTGSSGIWDEKTCYWFGFDFEASGITLDASIINADPQLISPASGDLRLEASSPCVGAGTRWWAVGSQPLDQSGLRFPLRAGQPDIGAHAVRPGEDGATRKAYTLPVSYLEAGSDLAKSKAA